MKMIKVNFRRPLVRRKHLICFGDNLMRWSWSGNSHRLMLIIWEMSALSFFWRNSDLMAMISLIWIFSVFWWWWWEWEWWLWKPPEVGSRPLLLFSIEDLVGERETGRDFKNHLVYRHLLVLVIIWTFFLKYLSDITLGSSWSAPRQMEISHSDLGAVFIFLSSYYCYSLFLQ